MLLFMRSCLFAAALCALVACGAPSEADIQAAINATATTVAADACSPAKLTAYADAMTKQLDLYDQQRQLVASTPRVSLGTPLQRLLDLQTETSKMIVPDCVKSFHERAGRTMTIYQMAYQQFAAQADDTIVQTMIEGADKFIGQERTDLATIKSGKIPPEPTPMATLTPTK